MPFDCQHRTRFGPDACLTGCPVHVDPSTFQFVRVEHARELPPADPRLIDVALLDMHHGWPNLGHDALVHAIQDAACDLHALLREAGLGVRVTSYDVRRGLVIPEAPGPRHAVYVGTGGPGHLDPRRNDGRDPGSQGIVENPAWEAPLFRLFDAIAADEQAALFGVCHTFGVMCRWLGIADAVLRGPDKGGKSAGIVENVLSEDARRHPWFSQFAAHLPDGRHFPVLDSRLYDLVPRGRLPAHVTGLAHEALGRHGPPGEALTMIEVAPGGQPPVPRVLGVNHHPEIVNRERLRLVLERKFARGRVPREWYEERWRTLAQPIEDDLGERLLHLTSSYTILAPLRARLYREAARRARARGIAADDRIARLPLVYRPAADVVAR